MELLVLMSTKGSVQLDGTPCRVDRVSPAASEVGVRPWEGPAAAGRRGRILEPIV